MAQVVIIIKKTKGKIARTKKKRMNDIDGNKRK
jgi:hypothetical protein